MDQQFDITIIGGGTIGLACALALSEKLVKKLAPDIKILILDRNLRQDKISLDYDGRNIALNSASMQFMQNLGVWGNLAPNGQAINHIIVSDGDTQKGASDSYIHFNAQDIDQENFGTFVLNPYIHQVLLDKIDQSDHISLASETYITDIENHVEYNIITDQNDNRYQTKLLIAADGRNSFVRNHCGIHIDKKDYRKTAIVLAVSHEKPHQGFAQEFFLPSGPFAILPLPQNKCSLVWVEDHAVAKAFLEAPDDVFFYELTRRFGDYLGNLEIISKKFSYPLIRQIAQNVIAPRTILIGDAAHVIHPISGQGFNLGLRDIGYLVDIIAQYHYAGLDYGSEALCNQYQNQRLHDIQMLGTVTNGIDCLFSNDILPIQTLRRLGLEAVNQTPFIRNFFSKTASLGAVNPLPTFMETA